MRSLVVTGSQIKENNIPVSIGSKLLQKETLIGIEKCGTIFMNNQIFLSQRTVDVSKQKRTFALSNASSRFDAVFAQFSAKLSKSLKS